jgi:hypothetical protein
VRGAGVLAGAIGGGGVAAVAEAVRLAASGALRDR